MKQQAGNGGRETVKGTVSQSTHGSVIELRSSIISTAKKNVHQSWTLATLSQMYLERYVSEMQDTCGIHARYKYLQG
jgi:hypothetical protein